MVVWLVVVDGLYEIREMWFSVGTMKGKVDGKVELGVGVTSELSVWISNSVDRKIG